jgi:outer membrane lipoprotein-sorting protein
MRLFVATAATIAVLAAAASAPAYEIEDLLRDARAYHAKMMTEVHDLTIEQEAMFHAKGAGSSGMSSTMYRKGDRWRNDAKMSAGGMSSASGQSFEATTLFDGKDVWSVTAGIKAKVPPGGVQGQSSVPAYWNEPVEGSKVVGEETVGGRACWIVQAPSVAGAPAGIGAPKTWIDKKKFVHVQSEVLLSGKTVKSVFSDFRAVKGGFELPYVVDVFSDGQKTMTAKITKLETNTGLSDDLFDASKLGGGATSIDVDALMKQAEEMRKKMEAQHGSKSN